VVSFGEFSDRKTRDATSAPLSRLVTLDDRSSGFATVQIGNAWSSQQYDGLFHLPDDAGSERPLISLVFVQSRDGNTGASNPASLGGGPVDLHLIYEGLSRVGADAVLAGARTIQAEETFFSVWHPELVALRGALGLPRHPAQIVVTGTGCLEVERNLLFNVPEVPVYVISTPGGCEVLERAVSTRPWAELVPMRNGDLAEPLEYLRRARGISRISSIGGRTTASSLIDAGLVQDICLTTTARVGGETDTPLYVGKKRPPRTRLIVRKRGEDPAYPILFEHLRIVAE
jgi:riboflavin biosynthesis pyrimidine reductase